MESPESRTARYLARYDLRLDDVSQLIRPVGPAETLLLVGSVPEGLANEESDLDLILIGEGVLEDGLVLTIEEFENSTVRLPSGLDLNCELLRPAALRATASRFAPTFDAIRQPESVSQILLATDHELRTLHRLRSGVALANPKVAEAWRQELRLDELPGYVVLFALAHHLEYREDAIAQAKLGDARTAVLMLRLSMDYLAFALLGSVDETNQHPKWRVRLLERQRAVLGDDVVERCIAALFPKPQDDPRGATQEAIAFADAVIQGILERHPELLKASLELNQRFQFTTHTG